jgi:ATP-dependent Clp protease, protease subunit
VVTQTPITNGENMHSLLLSLLFSVGATLDTGNDPMVQPDGINKPIVIYISDVTEDRATSFVAQIEAAQETGQTIVPIYISSYGGSVYALIEMIDAIKKSKIPVATIAVGKAMSCGAVLLAMGSSGMRYAAPNATIMIHEISSGTSGKLGEMMVDVEETNRLNTLIFKIMAENIGKPADYFIRLIIAKTRSDWFMAPSEALGIGLIDKIGTPTLKVKVKVQTILE